MIKQVEGTETSWRVVLLLPLALMLLSACGGGGGGGGSGGGGGGGGQYACDQTSAIAGVVTTQSITGVALTFNNTPALIGPVRELTERWSLVVGGSNHELNVKIVFPPAGAEINGVVFDLHGISPSQSVASVDNLSASSQQEVVSRGYISIAVARRGNFGSTGQFAIGQTDQGTRLLADYQARRITYADLDLAAWRYQSDSMVAALQYASTLPEISAHLHSIILIGASGGAPTAIQTSVDSAVFRNATRKAIIRVTGNNSALDTNPEATPGSYEYYSKLAPLSVSTFWAGGLLDPLTSPGILACQYRFFATNSPVQNSMILVPGWGHGSPQTLFSDQYYSYVRTYLVGLNFTGF